MKLLRLSKTFRRRWLAAGCFAILAAASASAQMVQHTLTDADIARWLPRLRAEAAAFTKTVSEGLEVTAAIQSYIEAREKFWGDIDSGKTDVLAWMRSHADHVLVPSGAVYSADCSRVESGNLGKPTAVFTFGKESPYRDLLRRAAIGDEAARDEFNTRRGEEETGKRSAAAQATHDFIAGTLSFYRDHGFTAVEENRPITATFLNAPDGCVFVEIWEVNPFAGHLPLPTPSECSSLPTGPFIEIRFEGETVALPAALAGKGSTAGSIAEPAGAPATEEKPAAGEKPAGQEKADAEYERVKEALFLAQVDAANPEALEFEIPSDAPPDVKANLVALAAEFAVRKANVILYKRHEAALAPLLEALTQTLK